jgi:hypothetical protein
MIQQFIHAIKEHDEKQLFSLNLLLNQFDKELTDAEGRLSQVEVECS